MNKPLLSIVIANYNYGRFLEAAIKSVVNQEGFDSCELIIVDGGSTDNSVDVIKKYANGLPPNTSLYDWIKNNPTLMTNDHLLTTKITWWVSEKDKGQSDAFNKGFAHARGRLGCWVNADDLLLPGTIRVVTDYLKVHPETEWIAGGTIFVDSDLKVVMARLGSSVSFRLQKVFCGSGCTMVGGPSSFFSISRLKDVGGFDLSLKYTMDGDLWYRFIMADMKIIHLPKYFWVFRIHEASKTSHSISSAKSPAFLDEDERLRKLVDWSASKVRLVHLVLRIIRILNGSIICSIFFTKCKRGKYVFDD